MKNARGATYFEYKLADHYHWSTNVWLRPRFALSLGERLEVIGYFGVVSLFLPISAWWRGCLNYYFFARSLWQPEGDAEGFLEETWGALFGEQSFAAGALISEFFESVQTAELLDVYTWHGEAVAVPPTEGSMCGLESAVTDALTRLNDLASHASDPRHALQLKRMSAYIEGFGIFYREKMKPDNRHPAELLRSSARCPPTSCRFSLRRTTSSTGFRNPRSARVLCNARNLSAVGLGVSPHAFSAVIRSADRNR